MRFGYAPLFLASLFAFPLIASGQAYPAKAIRIVVPLAAGGPGDLLARAIGQKLSDTMVQPVVIDNRPGANTNVGNEAVA
jgi:tripartite-type tricarboxylate transporter receptor subunit TctC